MQVNKSRFKKLPRDSNLICEYILLT